jgi:glycosyltransferase involved in cell wall biosynthesis
VKISIIIPTYNEQESIFDCLNSLLAQTLKPTEMILVDDGSTDNTLQIIKKFPVKVLTQKHQGPGIARNLGASKASSDILIFVDADMTFDKDFLKNLTLPIIKGKTKGTFNTSEFVSNWDNPWAYCWNLNQNLTNKNRLNPASKHDIKDFRAILKTEFDRVGGFTKSGDYTDSQSLSFKLGYKPTPVKDAISFHKNPETLTEVFHQVVWIGKRPTKLGIIGKIINLTRYSFPLSLIIGISKSIIYRKLDFLIFKVIYDTGFSFGILRSIFTKNLAK